MNKSYIFKLLAIAMVPLLLGACNDLFDNNEITLEDESQVEFKPLSNTVTLGQEDAGALSVEVQLIGEQRDQDTNLSIGVVGDESSAVEGDHYTLPTTSVTIPANESVASFDIEVTGENLSTGDRVQLVLELQSETEGIEPAANLSTYTLTLQGG